MLNGWKSALFFEFSLESVYIDAIKHLKFEL